MSALLATLAIALLGLAAVIAGITRKRPMATALGVWFTAFAMMLNLAYVWGVA